MKPIQIGADQGDSVEIGIVEDDGCGGGKFASIRVTAVVPLVWLDEPAIRNLGYACINAAEELGRRRRVAASIVEQAKKQE